jgi:pimeloyl-ACP methyl ester carboxylesterase
LKTFLTRLTDRLILRPSRNPIEAEDRRREWISTPNGEVEAWVTTNQAKSAENSSVSHGHENPESSSRNNDEIAFRPRMIALKFPGVAGRAERGGAHPFELVPDFATEIWVINPIGYGGSQGQAALASTAPTCDAVWEAVQQRFPNVPIFVIGNSLGCLSALYLAARQRVAGIYLRNPVPVQQMIRMRLSYNWWNLGLARLIANRVPLELDATENSKRAIAPMLLISSERDRVVPLRYQELIYTAYAGEKKQFILKRTDHHEPVPENQQQDYVRETREFLQRVFAQSCVHDIDN